MNLDDAMMNLSDESDEEIVLDTFAEDDREEMEQFYKEQEENVDIVDIEEMIPQIK